MIDIREGDYLVVGLDEYPVKAVEIWNRLDFNTFSFSVMANITASTKRSAFSDGKSGAPVAYLTSLAITPLDPVTQDIVERLALESPVRLLETFIADSAGFVHVIIEDLQHV